MYISTPNDYKEKKNMADSHFPPQFPTKTFHMVDFFQATDQHSFLFTSCQPLRHSMMLFNGVCLQDNTVFLYPNIMGILSYLQVCV